VPAHVPALLPRRLPGRAVQIESRTNLLFSFEKIAAVFAFLAAPDRHIFLKSNVTKIAAREYGFDFQYESRPQWKTYASLLGFADRVRDDLRDLKPRDMIDIQSFIWVQGSDEYEE
jgi:hypothetical protein